MTTWRRGCESAHCVEVLINGDVVQVRDSKDPDGPVLRFTAQEWEAFTEGILNGEFD